MTFIKPRVGHNSFSSTKYKDYSAKFISSRHNRNKNKASLNIHSQKN